VDRPGLAHAKLAAQEGLPEKARALHQAQARRWYEQADGSATAANNDYQTQSGTLTFAPGETSKTVTVLVNGDRLGEPVETFFVNLTEPTNAVITDAQGVGTIVDDEPRIGISDVTRWEGNTGTTPFVLTVSLRAAYDGLSLQVGAGVQAADPAEGELGVGFDPRQLLQKAVVQVAGGHGGGLRQ
jgi:hypothetical protein